MFLQSIDGVAAAGSVSVVIGNIVVRGSRLPIASDPILSPAQLTQSNELVGRKQKQKHT